MITKETLEAVNKGVLTDEQLNEAIKHYSELEKDLKCHGEIYHLVWSNVYSTLNRLNDFKNVRKENFIPPPPTIQNRHLKEGEEPNNPFLQ